MFLLSTPNNFYIVFSSYVEEYVKKNSSLDFMSLVGLQTSKLCKLFRKFTMEIVWNYFQAKIISYSLLFFDFLTVSHVVWKNQKSCESWLVGFWVNRHSKIQKTSANKFPFAFLSCHYGFTNYYFEILIFAFFNIITREASTCKIYFSRIITCRNTKL